MKFNPASKTYKIHPGEPDSELREQVKDLMSIGKWRSFQALIRDALCQHWIKYHWQIGHAQNRQLERLAQDFDLSTHPYLERLIAKETATMAEEDCITTKQAIRAVRDRKGEVWDNALERVRKDFDVPAPSQTIDAIIEATDKGLK